MTGPFVSAALANPDELIAKIKTPLNQPTLDNPINRFTLRGYLKGTRKFKVRLEPSDLILRMPQPASEQKIWTGQHTDGGPLYTESQFDNLVVEPYNALSAAIFLVLALAWAIKARGRMKWNEKFGWTLVLLAIGGLGGTLYHAFRSHPFFHLMDVLPIGLIGLGWSVVFLRQVFQVSWGLALFLDLLLAVGGFSLLQALPMQLAVSGMYVLLALLILGPVGILYVRGSISGGKSLLLCLCFFLVALCFRLGDTWAAPFLPMGTHWLWHCFSAVAVHHWLRFLSLQTKF